MSQEIKRERGLMRIAREQRKDSERVEKKAQMVQE